MMRYKRCATSDGRTASLSVATRRVGGLAMALALSAPKDIIGVVALSGLLTSRRPQDL